MPARAERDVSRRTLIAFAFVALACFGCDQASKEIARVHLETVPQVSLLHGAVELRLVENRGAFLSMGAALPEGVRTVAFQVALPLLLLVFCGGLLGRASQREAIGLALVVGGGAGNWIDRVLNDGAVTDFVQMGVGWLHTGIFNLADVAIVAGAAILLFEANAAVGHSRRSASRPAGDDV